MSNAAGSKDVRRMFAKKIGEVSGSMTEETVTSVLIIGGMYASALTPVDTSTLINSQYRLVTKNANGWTGQLGYGARYAADVHNASGKLKGQPRKTSGNYWDPNGEPEFLTKGFERDGKPEIEALIKRSYRV